MIYFDNAATTFQKPEIVYDKVINTMKKLSVNPGRGMYSASIDAAREIYKTRELLAALFNIHDSLQIAFTSNATDSLNLAIKGVLNKGDHVLTSSLEHNSVLRPLEYMQDLNIIKYTVLSYNADNGIDIDELEDKISSNTKAVVINHVSNVTGQTLPIEEIGKICKKNKLLFIVDASQSAGVLEIDVNKQNIDILCFTGHKSLYGPQGVGGIYIRKGIKITPLIHGGTGTHSESLKQPFQMPACLESGTLNLPAIAGLGSAVEWINSNDITKIRKKELELKTYFIKRIEKNKNIKIYNKLNENTVGIVSININSVHSQDICAILNEKFNIACRGGLHCAPLIHKAIDTFEQGTVRISFSCFNSISEVDYLVEALFKICALLNNK